MFVTYHLTPWGRTLLTPRAESFLSLSLILTRCRSVSHTLSLPCNSCLSLTPPVLEPWESFITWSVTALLVSGVKPFVLFISPVPLFPCPRFTSSLSASISLPFPPHFHLHAYLYKKKKKNSDSVLTLNTTQHWRDQRFFCMCRLNTTASGKTCRKTSPKN